MHQRKIVKKNIYFSLHESFNWNRFLFHLEDAKFSSNQQAENLHITKKLKKPYVIVPASNAYYVMSQWQQPYCRAPQHKPNISLIKMKNFISYLILLHLLLLFTWFYNKAISFCYNFSKEVNDASLRYIRCTHCIFVVHYVSILFWNNSQRPDISGQQMELYSF